ncbi:MAG: hypothetical protein ACT4NU_10135 [Chromatiales bacterium]
MREAATADQTRLFAEHDKIRPWVADAIDDDSPETVTGEPMPRRPHRLQPPKR